MDTTDSSRLIGEASVLVSRARTEMAKRIVGKDELVRGILTGVIAGGHVLLEGVPGLAKTLAAKTFAEISGLDFGRVQFTPDLLPADITGSLVYEQAAGRFAPRKGPVFVNVLLADEVNRAPAKVQSALLEAMEEGQVTIGDSSLKLPEPFFVLATQNPIEHEGTYPLPEAQLDRFVIKVRASYPSAEEEEAIVRRVGREAPASVARELLARAPLAREPLVRVLGAKEIAFLRSAAESVRVDEALAAYAVRIVRATRPSRDAARAGGEASRPSREAPRAPASRNAASGAAGGAARGAERDVDRWIEYGASPRASIQLFRCARIRALMEGRPYVLPEDVKASAPEVLRHRLVLTYEAEAEGVDADAAIERVLGALDLP